MKNTLTLFALLLLVCTPAAAQNTNTSTTNAASARAKTTRRGPVFRAKKSGSVRLFRLG